MVMELLDDAEVPEDPRPAPSRKKSSPWLMIIAILGIVIGAATVITTLFFPQEAEKVYGSVQRNVGNFRLEVLGEVPEVTLGASGGQYELDRCDGTFTEMLSYESDEVPPVWAAHNNCSGDVLLPWELGQQVLVKTGDQEALYEVVDIRLTPKTWATIDDIEGLGGDFALQSCFYGEDRMKFIGLQPVAT